MKNESRKKKKITEKVRAHHGNCIVCEGMISESRMDRDHNEPFCCERCETVFYEMSAIPRNLGIKFVHNTMSSGLKIYSKHTPSFFQNVMIYDKKKRLPENFVPLSKEGKV